MQLHRYFKLALTTLVLAASTAQAAYNLRYTTIAPGAVTFTGNTIGLNKASGSNNPGTSQAIGAYIAEGQGAATYSGHPAPTTSNWLLNRSTATLNIPQKTVPAKVGTVTTPGQCGVTMLRLPLPLRILSMRITPIMLCSTLPNRVHRFRIQVSTASR